MLYRSVIALATLLLGIGGARAENASYPKVPVSLLA